MIGVAVCLSCAILLAPTSVTRWSSDRAVVGELDRVDAQGLAMRPEGASVPVLIAWHDVRGVELNAQQQKAYGSLMTDAWRAHDRLMRGDYPGALGIYARLAPDYLWDQGPQSADVSEGLMRCLLDQEQRVRSISPMLSWFVAAQVHGSGQGRTGDGYDATHALMTGLPPVFTVRDREVVLEALPESGLITDRERCMHACYALALRPGESGELVEQIETLRRDAQGGRDAGMELIEDVVFALAHPESEQRESARRALERRVRVSEGTWVEAWSRLGLGQALLHDPDPALRELGVIELIHVVVRLRAVSPPLALLAARMADEYLRSTDRAQWGTQLILDASRVSDDPALNQS